MRSFSSSLVGAILASLSLLPASAQADSLTLLRFTGRGVEAEVTEHGPVSGPAINTYGVYDLESEDPSTGLQASSTTTARWNSKTADAESNMFASVNGLNLKTRAHLEGGIAPSDVIVNCPYVSCRPDNYDADWNWESFSFESYAEALASDRGSIVSPTSTPSSFRLVFDLDGLNTSYADFFNVNATSHTFTGGGYEVPEFLLESLFAYNSEGWGHDAYSDLHYYRSDEGSTDFNPQITGAPVTDVASVVTDGLIVGANGAWDINLWLYSRARAEFTNLDAGRLLFLLESDYSHTVTLRGFEVFDAQGRLLPDAVVTGADGTVYRTLTGGPTSVPEPASVLLVGLGLMAAAGRRRRHGIAAPTPAALPTSVPGSNGGTPRTVSPDA